MAEETLEEYQKKAFKTEKAKFTFTAKASGVEETEASAPLKTHNYKFHIYFLRYILFPTKKINETNSAYKYDKELQSEVFPDSFDPKDAPKIDGFDYYYSTAYSGFLYLYDEDSNKWQEFAIDEFGLTKILWKKDSNGKYPDIRPTSEEKAKQFYPVKEYEKNLWVCFSPLQWSASYAQEVLTSDEKRSSRMQKISCEEWKGENPCMTDALSTKDISAAFYPNSWNNPQTSVQKSVFKSATQELSCDDDGNDYGNMCFALHDYYGIGLDMSAYLKHMWLEMNYLLIGLKTGVALSKIENCLINKKDNPESLAKNNHQLSQAKALFNLASTWKTIALINEENKEDLVECWGGLDMDRIDKVLGKKQRDTIKKEINTSRKNLLTYLKSDYYKKSEKDFTELTGQNLADAKTLNLLLLQQLATPPNKLDGFLETKEELQKWSKDETNKDVLSFIKDQLQGKGVIGNIIEKKSILEKVEDHSNLLKTFGIVNAILDIFTDLTDNGEEILSALNTLINKNVIKGFNDLASEGIIEISELYTEYRRTDLGEFTEEALNIDKNTRIAFQQALKKGVSRTDSFMKSKQLVFSKSFEKAMRSKITSKATQFQDSPTWKKLLRNLSAINFGLAAFGIRKSENLFEKYLSVSKIIQGSADLVYAQKAYSYKKMGLALTDGIERFGKVTGYVGAIIDAGESAYNFWERDYDAGVVYGTAAITSAASIAIFSYTSTIAAAAGTLGVAGTTMSWNVAGWACLLAAAGMGFYAAYLEDSPLERLAKNGIFSRKATKHLANEPKDDPIALIQQHLSHVDPMHKTGFTAWENLNNQYRTLMNLLINGRITITSNESVEYPINNSSNPRTLQLSKSYEVTQFVMELDFGGYLVDPDDLHIQIVYYPQGRDAGNPQVLSEAERLRYTHSLRLQTQKGKNAKAIYTFNIPDRYRLNSKNESINEDADLMIMAYLSVSNGRGQQVPIAEKDGTPNYIAAIHALQIKRHHPAKYRTDYKKDRDLRGSFRATENELLTTQGWI